MQNKITPLTLAEGWWAAYPCGDRMLRIYITTVVVAFILCGFLTGIVYIGARLKSISWSTADAQVTEPDFDRASKLALSVTGLAFFLLLSFIPALARSRTSLVATETSIVDTGCQFRTTYTETYDRQKLKIIYRFKRGKNDIDELYFIQKGKRRIRLNLHSSDSNIENFVSVAPEAMKAYAEQLRLEGKRLPSELANL